jgi:hypothetical protein
MPKEVAILFTQSSKGNLMRIAENWNSRRAWRQSRVPPPNGAQPNERRNACDYDNRNGIHLDSGIEKIELPDG